MPFGLKNASAVFQHLMQKVLMGLNYEEGSDFVSVYLDNVVFSEFFLYHVIAIFCIILTVNVYSTTQMQHHTDICILSSAEGIESPLKGLRDKISALTFSLPER